MTNFNGNGKDSIPLSTPSTAEALAQLKEAVGLLWRRVDEAGAKSTQETQQTHQKLDTWIQTNLTLIESNQELIKAVVLNSQESRKSIDLLDKATQQSERLSSQLKQFETATSGLQQALKQPSGISNPSSSPSMQALSNQISVIQASIDGMNHLADPNSVRVQLNDLQTILTNNTQTIEGMGQSTNKIKSSLTEIKNNLTWNGKKSVQWTPLILAIAIGGLCWFFGSKQGFNSGQLDVAGRWFGGIENLDYWRQVRNLNKEQADQCRQQGRAECPLRLP